MSIKFFEELKYFKSTLLQENLSKWSGEPEKLLLHTKDMRGKPETIDVLKMNGEELYILFKEVYELGKNDARRKIKDAIEGR